jgi:hypothetical protein
VRCIATVRAQTTENTAPVSLAECVLQALPSSGTVRHSMVLNFGLISRKVALINDQFVGKPRRLFMNCNFGFSSINKKYWNGRSVNIKIFMTAHSNLRII